MLGTENQTMFISAFVNEATEVSPIGQKNKLTKPKMDLLRPVKNWLESLPIENREFATLIAKAIPAQCPFERDIVLFGRKVGHIPPMCKLNPLYEEFVGLRFRALCYLVDVCGEDIQSYC